MIVRKRWSGANRRQQKWVVTHVTWRVMSGWQQPVQGGAGPRLIRDGVRARSLTE